MSDSLCKYSSSLCGHDPECGDTDCPGRPSFPLHRQVMPPEPEDGNAGYWWMFGIAAVAVICAVLAVIHFAQYQHHLFR